MILTARVWFWAANLRPQVQQASFYLFAETHPRVDTSPTDFVKWLDEVANVDIWEDEAEALLNGVF